MAAQTPCSRSASGRPKSLPVSSLLGHIPMKTAMVAAEGCRADAGRVFTDLGSFAKEPGWKDAGVGERSEILTRSLVQKDLLRGVISL